MSRRQEIHTQIANDGITRIQTLSSSSTPVRSTLVVRRSQLELFASCSSREGVEQAMAIILGSISASIARWGSRKGRPQGGLCQPMHKGRNWVLKLSPIVGDTNRTDTEQQELQCALFRRRHWRATFNFASLFLSIPCTHSLLWAKRNEYSKRWRILGPSLPPSLTFLSSHLRFLFARSRPCLHLYFLASTCF